MARPLRIEFDGAFYHVTSRGNAQTEMKQSAKHTCQMHTLWLS